MVGLHSVTPTADQSYAPNAAEPDSRNDVDGKSPGRH